jgi:phage terminase large subunit-like protein
MASTKHGKNFNIVMEYARNVVGGKKIACVENIQACQRFLNDLQSGEYDFNEKSAEFVIQIIEKTFVHIKGPKKGQPFLLEAWEKFICYNLAGFYIKGTKERRYHEAFIFIPRKNGKTAFAAALAWAFSLLDMRYTSVLYMIATKLDRALESFDVIKRNIKYMGEESNFKIMDSNAEHSISRTFENEAGEEIGSIKMQALASNSEQADGLNANIIILDEIHAYRSPNDYFVYKQAMKAYVNKLLIGITTAGAKINSFCYQRLCYCQKVLAGTVKDEQYFIFICKADNPADYLNPIEHEKANPNYGITIRPQDMEAEALQAQNDPSSRNEFLNKSLNIYTNVADSYFDMAEVQVSDESYNWTIDELIKLPIAWTGGADLSVMHDLTAACLYGEYNGVSIVITHGFMPITRAHEKSEEDNIPFFWWQEAGWLTLCNADTVDYNDVVKWFVEMKRKGFKINTCGFDKYKSRDFYRMMVQSGFKMEQIDQAYWKKSEAFRYIEKQIKDKKFYYLHSKAFEYCIGNVKAVEDFDDRIRFEKVAENARMDLFDCTVIAVKQFIDDKDKKSKINKWFN